MSYYLETDSHIRHKDKVVLYLSDNATKNNYKMLQALIRLI